MIVSFRHKGLREFFETGQARGINPQHANKLRMQLSALHTASTIEDVDMPGWRLHSLRGVLKGRWALVVDKNWRLTFEFSEGNVYLLGYEAYH